MTSGCADADWLATVSLEPMTPSDVPTVVALDKLCFPSAWSQESYLRELRNRTSHYVVARLEQAIIGFAGMWLIGDEAHISTLAVHPCYRRRGLAKRLLVHLLGTAEQAGASEVTLEVREKNAAARALYESFGFVSRSFIPRYYGDTGENAVVMAKRLPGPKAGETDSG